MKHLFLALLTLVSLTILSAQDDTEYVVIQRNHYTPGKFAEAVTAQEKMMEMYRTNGADLPVSAYVFDDNTIEFVYDVDSWSGLDLIQDAYDAADIRIGKARLDETLPKRLYATKRTILVGRTIDELSYLPEGIDLDEMKYIRVLRARVKTDDYEEFQRVAAEEAALAKKQNRQTPFVLQVFPVGYGTQEFEVVEFGRDRADFERREAESKKTHYSTKEYKAWEKKRDAVAEVISVRDGVMSDKMSRIAKKEESEDKLLLLVDEMNIIPGKVDAALQDWDTYRELSTQYHYPRRQRIAVTADESMMMRFTPVSDFADLERVMGSNRQMSYAPKSAVDKLNKSREGVYSTWNQYVLRLNNDLTYEQAKEEDESRGQTVWRMTEYEFPLSKAEEAYALLKEIKAAYVAADSPIAYEVYYYALSGPRNRVMVVTYGEDVDELDRRRREGNAALPEGVGAALNRRLETLMAVRRAFNGTTYRDRDYTPRKEVE